MLGRLAQTQSLSENANRKKRSDVFENVFTILNVDGAIHFITVAKNQMHGSKKYGFRTDL